jgi:hypothetical protein
MTDIAQQLDQWLRSELTAPDEVLAAARDEIIALRERLAESRDTLLLSMRESGKYAHRAGYCEGSLWLIAAGHPDPAAAAESTLKEVNK